jgi:hypothetical protein
MPSSHKSRTLYNVVADLLFGIHLIIVGILLLGWLNLQVLPVYSLALTATLLSEALLGYCPLTRWEFALRRKANPSISYGKNYLSYYAYKVVPNTLSDAQVQVAARLFLLLSLVALVYRLTLSP